VTKILFFGTPQFSVPTLETLCSASGVCVAAVITQPDRPSGRGGQITASPVKLCAAQYGIPTLQPHSLRKDFSSLSSELARLGPFDLGVVIAFGQLLPLDVLTVPKRGCVNIHASILPRWRGAAPIQRAIEAGDTETGVCLMQMDVGLDTGAVFSSARTPILDSDTYGSLHDRLSVLGAELLVRDLEAIIDGSLSARSQPPEGVSYANKVSPQEARIDWSHSAEQIARKIRAMHPHPGCYTMWEGKRLKILRAHPILTNSQSASAPGTVAQALSDTLVVNCGIGSLRVEEVQLEGKKKMLVQDFLRGSTMPVGTHLQ
jgi:methionyl-tRNA formyltransferase